MSRRGTLVAVLLANVVLYAFLAATAFLSVNHHMSLRRAGFEGIAAILAAHPFRWAVGAAVAGILGQLIVWRLTRDG